MCKTNDGTKVFTIKIFAAGDGVTLLHPEDLPYDLVEATASLDARRFGVSLLYMLNGHPLQLVNKDDDLVNVAMDVQYETK
ncbi:hypothetical protein EON65_51440 [archaeon]|nr:MAG: hypothetical protein EON65_51440 [archaeon]